MYKKHFNTLKGCKTPYAILKKEMIFIGSLMWVLHSEYPSAKERNDVLAKLKEG